MTVAELIDRLHGFPADLQVFYVGCDELPYVLQTVEIGDSTKSSGSAFAEQDMGYVVCPDKYVAIRD